MALTDAQFARIAPQLPPPSGHTTLPPRQVLEAWFYVLEHGCTWRRLPARFGN